MARNAFGGCFTTVPKLTIYPRQQGTGLFRSRLLAVTDALSLSLQTGRRAAGTISSSPGLIRRQDFPSLPQLLRRQRLFVKGVLFPSIKCGPGRRGD